MRYLILAALVTYAGSSLSIGTVNGLRTGQSQDLAPVYMASRLWLSGHNPYADYDLASWKSATGAKSAPELGVVRTHSTPYPPIALLNLAAISILEWAHAKKLWLAFNLILAVYVPLVIRYVWHREWSRMETALFVALWLGGIGLRIGLGNGQHTLFWFGCLITAMALIQADRPAWAGVFLALSLHKFQLTAFVVPYLLAKQCYRCIAVMAIVAGSLLGIFLVRVDAALGDVAMGYASEIGWWYRAYETEGLGSTNLYPVLRWMLGDGAARVVMYLLLAGSLIAVTWLSAREPMRREEGEVATLMAMSLWGMYHGTYDTILLILPLATLVQARRAFREGLAYWPLTLLLSLLVVMWFVDASKVYRLLDPFPLDRVPDSGLYLLLNYGYRVAVVVAFGALVALQVAPRRLWPLRATCSHGSG
jgi:Glycosyltransferase family 87